MIERVRRAAASSMLAQVELLGRDDLEVVVGVEPAGLRRRGCSSTSSSRLTSSMRATLRSVVRPRLSSEAHSSATPAFLEVLTSIARTASWGR